MWNFGKNGHWICYQYLQLLCKFQIGNKISYWCITKT